MTGVRSYLCARGLGRDTVALYVEVQRYETSQRWRIIWVDSAGRSQLSK